MASSPRAGKKLSAHELTRFLRLLTETGNFALSCNRLGRGKSGMYKRRARHAEFDRQCRTALALAHASLSRAERSRGRGKSFNRNRRVDELSLSTYAGRPQLRRTPASGLTQADLDRFLATLAATANIRFSARSVGAAHTSFYARARKRPGFDKAMRDALADGHECLEAGLVHHAFAWLAGEQPDPEVPPMPGMTAQLALSLLAQHRNTVRFAESLPDRRRNRGPEAVRARLEQTMRRLGLITDEDEGEDDGKVEASAGNGDAPEGEMLDDEPGNRTSPRIRRL